MRYRFPDPGDTAVFTTVAVLEGTLPIGCVSHDAEDGAWQFLPLGRGLCEETARVVRLDRILALDPTVGVLWDLPLGWVAERDTASEDWRRTAAS